MTHEEVKERILKYCFKPEKMKSRLKLGNCSFCTDKKINLFHRIMFRVLLGVKVERINNGKKTIWSWKEFWRTTL